MKKLLYVAPHLSTGGLPQYLVKKVELLKQEFEIHLVEWVDCTGGVLVVTRNKLVDLVDPNKFYTLQENKSELLDIIDKVKPDIIHLEEIPEFFMDSDIAHKLYTPDRDYFIVETSHDSSFDTNQKLFFPDKFMFVSDWQINQYKDINIPKVLVEYPIEYIDRPNREEGLKKLGLDPNKKHILHIGLFTPRKNQAEFFKYAKALPDYEFHCLGNQADNFKFYWEPLMKDKPDNLTWWNERTDVDKFYQSMDLFLFTSRGTANDKETMPLVIREALSYQIPQLLYNLPVYLNYFDKFNTIDYLEFDNFDKNCELIKDTLFPTFVDKSQEEVFVISTYPITDSIINTTLDCVKSIKERGFKVILTSHCPIPLQLQEAADYCIYDKNNILTKHTFYDQFWEYRVGYNIYINLRGENNDVYHGPTVYTNIYNGASLAKDLGYNKVHYVNYDYIISNPDLINKASQCLNTHDFYFGEHQMGEGKGFQTYYFAANPNKLIQSLPLVNNALEYNELKTKYNSDSNSLENIFYFIFNNLSTYKEQNFEELSSQSFDHRDYSRVEYFTILPSNLTNYFSPIVKINNSNDSRIIDYKVHKNGKLIIGRNFEIEDKFTFWDLIKFETGDVFNIIFDISDVSGNYLDTKQFTINDDYFKNILHNNGSFTWKGDITQYDYRPKIKLMHLVTEPDTNEKEIRSVKNVKDFCDKTGIKYEQRINKIWTETPPWVNCNRPNDIQDKPGHYKLAPGHYGCYLAHKNAICAEDNTLYDYVLVFEGDVIVDSDYNELYNALFKFDRISQQEDIDLIGFGNPTENRDIHGDNVEGVYTHATPFVPAQSYLITKNKINYIKEKLETLPWDAFDLWLCNVAQIKTGIADKIYTKHLPGFSIIEQEFKGMDEHSPEIYAK